MIDVPGGLEAASQDRDFVLGVQTGQTSALGQRPQYVVLIGRKLHLEDLPLFGRP
jgi:hypothetical protein